MVERVVTAGVLTEVNANEVRGEILFVELLTSTPARMWSGIGPITATMPNESSQAWTGMGNIGSVESIIESTDRRRNGVNMKLSGIDNDLLTIMLAEEYQGKGAKIWLAYLDGNAAIIPDPVLLFAGFMDTMQGADGNDSGDIILACESREQTLERSSRSLLTSAEQERLFPGDIGLEFVNPLQTIQVTWGAPSNTPNFAQIGGGKGEGRGR